MFYRDYFICGLHPSFHDCGTKTTLIECNMEKAVDRVMQADFYNALISCRLVPMI